MLLVKGPQHADVRTKCTLFKKWCNNKFLQRQVKTAIRKSSNRGDILKRLEQMYPVYETNLSVRTEIEELPPLPEFPTAARISEFVARLEPLMGRMNPSSYGPSEPHLWLVRKIPTRTWENCRETCEGKPPAKIVVFATSLCPSLRLWQCPFLCPSGAVRIKGIGSTLHEPVLSN